MLMCRNIRLILIILFWLLPQQVHERSALVWLSTNFCPYIYITSPFCLTVSLYLITATTHGWMVVFTISINATLMTSQPGVMADLHQRAARGVLSDFTEPSRRDQMWVNGRCRFDLIIFSFSPTFHSSGSSPPLFLSTVTLKWAAAESHKIKVTCTNSLKCFDNSCSDNKCS